MSLVLSRHVNEAIIIGHAIRVAVVDIRGDKVRIAIDAPSEVAIHRAEVEIAIEGGLPRTDMRTLQQLRKELRGTITKEANLRKKIAAMEASA